MSERRPHVAITVEWKHPTEATIINHSISSDVARTRLTDVMTSAVQHALETDNGLATVTITVVRKAEKPRTQDLATA